MRPKTNKTGKTKIHKALHVSVSKSFAAISVDQKRLELEVLRNMTGK